MSCAYNRDEWRCPSVPGKYIDSRRNLCFLHTPAEDKRSLDPDDIPKYQDLFELHLERARDEKVPMRLPGAIFPPGFRQRVPATVSIRLEHASFLGGEFLDRAQFVEGLTFHDCVFPARIIASALQCAKLLEFRACRLEKGFVFAHCDFRGDFLFIGSDAQGSDLGRFDDCAFRTRFDLSQSSFESEVAISPGTVFPGEFSVGQSQFRRGVGLHKVTFEGAADFSNAVFSNSLLANESTFKAAANFFRSRFDMLAAFSNTVFDGPVFFTATDFHSAGIFNEAIFASEVNFQADEREGSNAGKSFHTVSFRRARFMGAVDFMNRVFLSDAAFEGAVFHRAPKFHGCTFHQAMTFPRQPAFLDRSGEEAASAYRTLKLATESLRARREEAMFYALEQESLRASSSAMSRWDRGVSRMYEALSDYGQNWAKPLAILAGVVVLSTLVYAAWSSPGVSWDRYIAWDKLAQGFTFSVEQTVSPFTIWRKDSLTFPTGANGLAVRLVATAQSLVTSGLIALSLLALRWRFKRE